jgi:hypothetical protein
VKVEVGLSIQLTRLIHVQKKGHFFMGNDPSFFKKSRRLKRSVSFLLDQSENLSGFKIGE